MIILKDHFEAKFSKMFLGVPDLLVGEYEIKKFYIFDDAKFSKTVYFDTDRGFFKSTSFTLIASMLTSMGKIFQDQIDKGETIFVEVVNMRTQRGKFGLTFRLF